MRIDWLSLTTKIEGLDSQRNAAHTIAHILGGSWLRGRGRNGYTEGLRHDSGGSILWGGIEGMGVHVDLPSGALDWFGGSVGVLLYEYSFRCSRIDIATDVEGMKVDDILRDTDMIICRARERSLYHDLSTGGKTLYIGSKKGGDKLIRIYDKGIERGIDLDLLRVEVQLRNRYAQDAYGHLLSGGNMADILRRSIDFRMPLSGNVSRWPRLEWWECATAGATPGFRFSRRLEKPEEIEALEEWTRKYMRRPMLKLKLALGHKSFNAMIDGAADKVDVGYYKSFDDSDLPF